MSEPVNSVTMKVLQPLWNESSPRTNNCLAYSSYSYPGIGSKERALKVVAQAWSTWPCNPVNSITVVMCDFCPNCSWYAKAAAGLGSCSWLLSAHWPFWLIRSHGKITCYRHVRWQFHFTVTLTPFDYLPTYDMFAKDINDFHADDLSSKYR